MTDSDSRRTSVVVRSFYVLRPTPINFLRHAVTGEAIDIADLPDAEVRRLGKEMAADLLEHARKRRKRAQPGQQTIGMA